VIQSSGYTSKVKMVPHQHPTASQFSTVVYSTPLSRQSRWKGFLFLLTRSKPRSNSSIKFPSLTARSLTNSEKIWKNLKNIEIERYHNSRKKNFAKKVCIFPFGQEKCEMSIFWCTHARLVSVSGLVTFSAVQTGFRRTSTIEACELLCVFNYQTLVHFFHGVTYYGRITAFKSITTRQIKTQAKLTSSQRSLKSTLVVVQFGSNGNVTSKETGTESWNFGMDKSLLSNA
jgi:hypothetical protein